MFSKGRQGVKLTSEENGNGMLNGWAATFGHSLHRLSSGDKGENLFFIKPAARGISLHSFWDGLLGTSGKPQSHLNYAIMIEHEHRRKSLAELKKAKTPKDWSLESRGIAIEKAYLHGVLNGGTSKDSAQELSEGYTKAAKVVAEKQAALAGYRLADEIEKWVK